MDKRSERTRKSDDSTASGKRPAQGGKCNVRPKAS